MAARGEEAQVAVGETSPIVREIIRAEKRTTGEIRVHISERRRDKDPYASGLKIFHEHKMTRTQHRNGVLLYVNRRLRRFAIVADTGIHAVVGQSYWDSLAQLLADDLKSTHWENAVSMAVRTIGVTLSMHFPAAAPGKSNPDELSNEVSRD